MRSRSAGIAISVASAALGLVVASAAPAREGPDAVATVNDEPITRDELVEELLIRHGKAVLEDLIRQRAIEQEMARARITVTDEEIENEIERERRELEADPRETQKLEEKVAERYQMSMEGYREIVRRWLLVRKVILRRENPADDELLLWFYQNRERYDVPAEMTVRHIFVSRTDPRTGQARKDTDLRERMAIIRDELIRGVDFGRIARRRSDDLATRARGGELGTVNERAARAHLEPAFVEAMVLLKPGQSGGPVETPKGYHYLQVTGRREGRKIEYDEVRARVRLDYMEDRAILLREVFLRGLMERTRVTRDFTPPARRRPEDAAFGGPPALGRDGN